MPRLIISSPDGKNGILELSKPVTTVGRGNANDLVLNDSSVSRFHAVIKLRDDSIFVADRGSTNGIILNDEKITQETELKDGDTAVVGNYRLRLENVDEQAIQVRRGQWPSTLNNIIHGRSDGATLARSAGISSSALTDLAGRIKKLERENYLLTVLYEAGKALNSKLALEHICEQVVSLACLIEGVERGFVMLFDESGKVVRQSEVRYRDAQVVESGPTAAGSPGTQIILSKSVLEMIRRERQPILIEDVRNDERFNASESMKISGLRSAMCAPLQGKERLFGILYVDNLEQASAFTQEELNVFALVAAQAGAAIDNLAAHEKIAQQTLQRSALERFLSPEVAEMVVANPDIRLGGVNQEVTVLFADIRDFTPMSENLEPSLVVEILNEYFTRVTDVIFDNGGTLDKYIGDAVMAVFGAPISKGKDAANAVKSAIQIQRLLIELNRDAGARNWPELRVGIGINTGNAVAGNIGSPRRLDYTVVGDVVNTAQRLMANAAGGQILIAESTASKLNRGFDLERLPEMKVKGRSEAVPVFSVGWKDAPAAATVSIQLKKKRRPVRGASRVRKIST
ncbi:MAG TPA: adenylate/guanylate cyclase domain-containing protein [Candidatus Angelobacter sp.]|nr:adenylate/guanylate cyclase domain-containing protein [Candidatus Angelobacter sp.]